MNTGKDEEDNLLEVGDCVEYDGGYIWEIEHIRDDGCLNGCR